MAEHLCAIAHWWLFLELSARVAVGKEELEDFHSLLVGDCLDGNQGLAGSFLLDVVAGLRLHGLVPKSERGRGLVGEGEALLFGALEVLADDQVVVGSEVALLDVGKLMSNSLIFLTNESKAGYITICSSI